MVNPIGFVILILAVVIAFFVFTTKPSEVKGISRIDQIINFIRGNLFKKDLEQSGESMSDSTLSISEQTKEQPRSEV